MWALFGMGVSLASSTKVSASGFNNFVKKYNGSILLLRIKRGNLASLLLNGCAYKNLTLKNLELNSA